MKRLWASDELIEHWTLLPADLALLANKAGATRLGFAILLKAFQCDARFPEHKGEVPGAVVACLAEQVGVPTNAWLAYDWRGRASEYHRAQIREALGFRPATVEDAEGLARWLTAEVAPREGRPDHLQAAAYAHCRTLQIEPPAPARVERLIRSAWQLYEAHVYATIQERLPLATGSALDALLAEAAPAAPPVVTLHDLRTDPGRAGLDSILGELAKLRRLRDLQLPPALFRDLAPRLVQQFRRRAAVEPPSALRAHPDAIRQTLLAALGQLRSREITDTLLDLFVQLIHQLGSRAEQRVEQTLLAEFKRVTGKTVLLFQLAEAALAAPDGTVREVVFPIVGEQTLRDLVREAKATGGAYRQQVQGHMRASYGSYYRRLVPPLLATLVFRSNNERHRPVIRALALLRTYADSRQQYYDQGEDVPLDGVLPPAWREVVVERDARGRARIARVPYEICALIALREGLRSREIWVEGADRYRDPDADLPADFDRQRAAYYAALRQPPEAEAFVATLRRALTDALDALARDLPANPSVRLRDKGPGGAIVLSPLPPQAEAPNLAALKGDLVARWPMTNLLDILKEADLRADFTRHFTSVAAREALDRTTLQKRLLLCLYGLGTNTGLKRVATADPGSTDQDLRYVRRRFIHKEQLRNAIAHVVDATFAARLPRIWGEGTTACASDSKKFGAWDQNLMTEWHIRYGGRGVMIYWHVERKATCIYSQLKQCSSSEVAAMIEGVLRHCTTMAIEKNYVDSHGQSEVAFAFTHLLGFRLLPRLKDLPHQKLYRPTAGQPDAFPGLAPILTRPINWDLIARQYDELVKYATALRLGTAETEAILRRFTRSNVQHPTYQALAELGKAVKTIFLCDYLRSEALRREIQEGLNVVENWNSANSFIFYGKGGEIAANRLEDQEVAVLALHLLQVCLVYINTLMLQEVLAAPAWADRLGPADLRALTPLLYGHVNPYGTFQLDMTTRLALAQSA